MAIQVDTWPHHYIDDPDNGSDWCLPCAKAEIAKRGRGEALETWDDCDTPPVCEGCGAILSSALTSEGGLYELDHFADSEPEAGDIVAAYELRQMAKALVYATKYPDAQSLVAAICARFLAATAAPIDRWADDGGPTE